MALVMVVPGLRTKLGFSVRYEAGLAGRWWVFCESAFSGGFCLGFGRFGCRVVRFLSVSAAECVNLVSY
jgi:hypothetical protein